MFVTVRLFAGAAQIAGNSQVRLHVDNVSIANRTILVGDVVRQLSIDFPQLRNLLETSRWALGDEFVGVDFTVDPEHTLVMIPPVSGG